MLGITGMHYQELQYIWQLLFALAMAKYQETIYDQIWP